jgi:hypothetical protein
MNIFIDTSVLYKDPFWSSNFYAELLYIVKKREVNLYLSNVVVLEIERNYGKIIDEEISRLKKLTEQTEHYQIMTSNTSSIDKEKSIENLKTFYKKLETEKVIEFIPFSNDMMPEIVDRAIWRKKPFSESKTELKDAIIWLSYSQFAEQKKLNNCILLTDNVSDFCDSEKLKKGLFEIHQDLQKDSNRFRIYKSPKELIQQEKSTLQYASQLFSTWLNERTFDEQFLLDLIKSDYRSLVERKIDRKFENYDLHYIFDEDYYLTGYVSADNVDINDIKNINVDVFNEECLISGDLYVYCNVVGYEYNAVRDTEEDRHRYYGEKDALMMLTFSFYYDRNEKPRNFDIDDVELVEII